MSLNNTNFFSKIQLLKVDAPSSSKETFNNCYLIFSGNFIIIQLPEENFQTNIVYHLNKITSFRTFK
jgi:hypothetical protein